jgi:uncharacterized membrane protein
MMFAASDISRLAFLPAIKEMSVFDQVNGLPVHALVLHAAVIFIPLLALAAVVYAVVPPWRSRIWWAALLLALVAPVTAFVTRESGLQLYTRVIARGISAAGHRILDNHMNFGTLTMWFTIALGVVTLILVLATVRRPGNRLPRAADLVLALITVVLAGISGYYVFRTGDSGATAVWGTY